MKYRCKHEIYCKILELCQEPKGITRIMELCRLSGATVYEHVKQLHQAGLISKIEVPKLKNPLFLTNTLGYKYLQLWKELKNLLRNK